MSRIGARVPPRSHQPMSHPAGGGVIPGEGGQHQVSSEAVTQHSTDIRITFSQITDTIADAQVPASAVTQHQAALSLLFTQLTDTIANAQVPASAVTQHQAALSLLFTQLTDSIANAQVPAAAVTQHQAALAIGWGQITGEPTTLAGYGITDALESFLENSAKGYELSEMTADPAAPAANKVRVFSRDNGAGKTQICALFPTGAVQVLATEP
jgi:hypothetical protein